MGPRLRESAAGTSSCLSNTVEALANVSGQRLCVCKCLRASYREGSTGRHTYFPLHKHFSQWCLGLSYVSVPHFVHYSLLCVDKGRAVCGVGAAPCEEMYRCDAKCL